MDTFNIVDNESRIGQSVGSFLKRRRVPPQEILTESFDEITVDRYITKMATFKNLTPAQLLSKSSIIHSMLSPLRATFQKLSNLYLSLETKSKEFVKEEYGVSPAEFMTVVKRVEGDMIKSGTIGPLKKISKPYSLIFTMTTLSQMKKQNLKVSSKKLYDTIRSKLKKISEKIKRREKVPQKTKQKKGELSLDTKLLLVANMVAMFEALWELIPDTKKFKAHKTTVLKVLLALTVLAMVYSTIGAIKEAYGSSGEE